MLCQPSATVEEASCVVLERNPGECARMVAEPKVSVENVGTVGFGRRTTHQWHAMLITCLNIKISYFPLENPTSIRFFIDVIPCESSTGLVRLWDLGNNKGWCI